MNVRRCGGTVSSNKGRTDASRKTKQLSLWLVDDDAELCGMMKEFFSQLGHRLECAYNGRDGLARALEHDHDLVVLDVMLPVISGFTVFDVRTTPNGAGAMHDLGA
jgi:CheY-like chemotaxis protein